MGKRFGLAALAAWCACFCTGPAARAGATMGWRGDGTGKFPAADPPTTWGRVSKAALGLRFLASEPEGAQAGKAMPDGVAREWLLLGPVPVPENGKVEEDTLPGEAQLAPAEGDRVGALAWKKATLETACLDFASLFGKAGAAVAYACTRIYSETGGAFRLDLTFVGKARLFLNGKEVQPFAARVKLVLAKGWNRLLLKAAPGEEDWYVVQVLHAWAPAACEETNIAWTLPLPGAAPGFYGGGMGVGSPVIVGDRLYLLSEPHDLVCIRKADGRILWVRTNSYFDAATDEDRLTPAFKEAEPVAAKLAETNAALASGPLPPERLAEKAKLEKELYEMMKAVDPKRYKRSDTPDVGFSGYTPSTDGRFIYLWLATGVSACYDLDGRRKWIRVDNRPGVEHGFSSSPVLVDGKLVVFMRDLMAFDAATGALAWQLPLVTHRGLNPGGFFHGSLVATAVGGVPLIVLGNGTIVRASDGKMVSADQGVGIQSVASPVVEGDTVLQVSSGSMQLFIRRLPAAFSDPLKVETRVVDVATPFPKYYMPWHLSSPVVHEGLAYLVNNTGVLTVVDLGAGRILYQKLLDLDAFQWVNEGAARGVGVSPALAGGRLYVLGNSGGALVLEPGRVYRQVAKNKLESVVMAGHWSERQERFVASPVFDGRRLYIRGEGNLYAIEAR